LFWLSMTPVHERSLTNVFYRFHSYGLRSDAVRFPFLPQTLRRVAKNVSAEPSRSGALQAAAENEGATSRAPSL